MTEFFGRFCSIRALRHRNQHGAAVAEYALALAVLVPVFIFGMISIESAARIRAAETSKAVKIFVPCYGQADHQGDIIDPFGLRGDECF